MIAADDANNKKQATCTSSLDHHLPAISEDVSAMEYQEVDVKCEDVSDAQRGEEQSDTQMEGDAKPMGGQSFDDVAADQARTCKGGVTPTGESIANRVRKRHRDVRLSNSEEELTSFSEFVGFLQVATAAVSRKQQQDAFACKAHELQEHSALTSLAAHLSSQAEKRAPTIECQGSSRGSLVSQQGEQPVLQQHSSSASRRKSNPQQIFGLPYAGATQCSNKVTAATASVKSVQFDEAEEECFLLSKGGRSSFLCNHCPFEATEISTVFRHLFAAHVFRCGRCSFYSTSRWKLRCHEQSCHSTFLDDEYLLEPMTVKADPVGDGFSLLDTLRDNEIVARMPSSQTPRLMNGLAGFVPSSIVTPIVAKNLQHQSSSHTQSTSPPGGVPWKRPAVDRACNQQPPGAVSDRNTQNVNHPRVTTACNDTQKALAKSSSATDEEEVDNQAKGFVYKCNRCEYATNTLNDIKAHCTEMADRAFICPGTCHFGSPIESVVRAHYFNCLNSNRKPNELQPANFINKDRFNVERFFVCVSGPPGKKAPRDLSLKYDQVGWDDCTECDELAKCLETPSIFVLRRSTAGKGGSVDRQISDVLPLTDEMNLYATRAALNMGLAKCLDVTGAASFYSLGHRFILAGEESHFDPNVLLLSCPTQQSPEVQCGFRKTCSREVIHPFCTLAGTAASNQRQKPDGHQASAKQNR